MWPRAGHAHGGNKPAGTRTKSTVVPELPERTSSIVYAATFGLDPAVYGTHSMRGTKASLIARQTKNLRAIQLHLGHTKLASPFRYAGIESDEALEMAEQIEI